MRDLFRLLSFLLRLSRQTRRSRAAIVLAVGTGVASGAATTGLVALTTTILSQGRPGRMVAGGFAALCLALPLCRFVSRLLLTDLAQGSLLTLRVQLTCRVLATPLRRLEALGAPRLLATLTNDIGTIVDALGMVPSLFMNLTIVGGCLIYLGFLSWPILLGVLFFAALGVVSYQLPLRRALRHFQLARRGLDTLFRQLRSLQEGTKELQMHRARRRAFLGAVESGSAAFERENRRGSLILAATASWGQVLFFIAIGLLVLALPRLQPVDKKVLIGYTIVLFQLMAPLDLLLTAFPTLSRAIAAARNVEELGLELPTADLQPGAAPAAVPGDWHRLELLGVTHRYRREGEEEEGFLLGPLHLSFRPGELIFVVGGNGSGKTTFAKVLLGLYAPESGEVRLDGVTIAGENLEAYREHFSAVFSDCFVFDALLGLDDPNLDGEARRYLAALHLDQKVRVSGGVLSTVDLSQGQRKRLALLAAYLEDRPIYLFDEWAADQDPSFKELFYLHLLPELRGRGKTVFVITHDDRFFPVADRIIKLDYGEVARDCPAAEHLSELANAPRVSTGFDPFARAPAVAAPMSRSRAAILHDGES